MRTAHLADHEHPDRTACGEPWEPWQVPNIPSDEEIGFDDLPFEVQRIVRREDRERTRPAPARQCQACMKQAKAMA